MADMTQFERATDQVVEDSERLHKVVNGTATETVITEDGSEIPTVRKALLDSLYFKTPPLPWQSGGQTTVYNQLYAFNSVKGIQWWYAPGATASAPIYMPSDPSTSVNWRLYNDSATMAELYAPLNSPVFTGNPQAPTAPAGSANNNVATTAFVAKAVTDAVTSISGGSARFASITVTGVSNLSDVNISGNLTVDGTIEAENSNGRLANIFLTKADSSLSFDYTDTDNQTFTKTEIGPYTAQTHDLKSDSIVNGVVSSDNTTMSMTGVGNNQFDYVYIKGNSEKDVSEPLLKVSGNADIENLNITGSLTGVSFGVDGQEINPSSVTTADGVSVGGSLQVSGDANFQSTTAASLEVVDTLTVAGTADFLAGITATNASLSGELSVANMASLSGGFNTINADGTVGGNLSVVGQTSLETGVSVTGEANISGDLVLSGDARFNAGSGTTTVNNLVVQGTVSGLNIDLTEMDLLAQSVTSATNLSASGDLFVAGTSNLASQDEESLAWSGDTVVNNLTIHGAVTGFNPDLSASDVKVTSLESTGDISGAAITGTVISGESLNVPNATVTGDLSAGDISANKITMKVTQDAVSADYTPDGSRNIYYLTVSAAMTLGAVAVTEGEAFSMFVYIKQDATGGWAVAFDPAYAVLNDEAVNTAPDSVTILQIVYCGVGDVLDLTVIPRP